MKANGGENRFAPRWPNDAPRGQWTTKGAKVGVKTSRRGAIGICVAVMAALLLLASCSSGEGAGKASSGSDGSGGAVLRIAYPETLTSLDITDSSGATVLKEVAGTVETLVNVDSSFKLSPSLATSWQRTSDTTWEFKLRDNVKFHDGTDCNANAVKWCFDRQLREDKSFKGYTNISSTEVVDDHTLRFTTAVPTGELPEALTNVATAVIAQSSVDQNGTFVKPVGTGYFQYKNFDPSTGNCSFTTFDHYWGGVADSNVTERDVFSMSDPNTRSLAVQNGEIDIATDVPFTDLQTLKNNDKVKVSQFNTARTYFNVFNTKKAYLKDKAVRQALLMSINYDEMVQKALMGVGSVPDGIFMKDVPWNNPDVQRYAFDPEKAKSMLDAAGFVDSDGDGMRDFDGQKVKLSIVTGSRRPGGPLIAQAVQGYFKAIGVDSDVQVLDGTALSSAQSDGTYDLWLSSAATGYIPSASYYLSQYYESSSKTAQYAGYSDSALDALIDKCRSMESSPEKYEVSKQAQVPAQDDAVITTLANYGAVFALNPKITGFSYSAAVHDFVVPYTTGLSS